MLNLFDFRFVKRRLTQVLGLFIALGVVVGCGLQPAATNVDSTPTHAVSTFTVTASATEVQKSKGPLIMAHYMPWYQTPSTSGAWGWHWTMNHFDPASAPDANGHLAIASHYYPLTGPYDSGDDAILEYQVMLMKLSGVDGVIVDWYGSDDFWDYGAINKNTHKLFEYTKKAGLLFSICYEDRTIENMINNGFLDKAEVQSHGQQTMLYLQENWLGDDSYLKASGHPVIFVFGNPPYFRSTSDWESLFSVLGNSPVLITEDNPMPPVATSSYPWPPMSMSQNGVLTQEALKGYLSAFYQRAEGWDYLVAGAFPGFHDIYKEAGVNAGYGVLDAQDGKTFELTLQTALSQDPDVIQLITWNDYGEGTNIEPTFEYGHRYLEILQDFKHSFVQNEFKFSSDDLAIPLEIFNLRNQYKGDSGVNARLDEAFNAVVSGDIGLAKEIIATYSTPTP